MKDSSPWQRNMGILNISNTSVLIIIIHIAVIVETVHEKDSLGIEDRPMGPGASSDVLSSTAVSQATRGTVSETVILKYHL